MLKMYIWWKIVWCTIYLRSKSQKYACFIEIKFVARFLTSWVMPIMLWKFPYCWLLSTKWSFSSFRDEFWSVKFIERWDFFFNFFYFLFQVRAKIETKNRNLYEVKYWTVYNSLNWNVGQFRDIFHHSTSGLFTFSVTLFILCW